ncbi:MAG: hypothetical protein AB1425_00330 [Actinomycetota bacterium]
MAEGPGIEAMVLCAYSVRHRAVRGADGRVSLLWGSLGIRLPLGDFVDLARMMEAAGKSAARYGELARGARARVVRCSMGQVALHQGDLTLWFTPEEFEDFRRLILEARSRLADSAPMPRFGVRWEPEGGYFAAN